MMHISFQSMSLGEAITVLKQQDNKVAIDDAKSLAQLVSWLQQLKDYRRAVDDIKIAVGNLP